MENQTIHINLDKCSIILTKKKLPDGLFIHYTHHIGVDIENHIFFQTDYYIKNDIEMVFFNHKTSKFEYLDTGKHYKKDQLLLENIMGQNISIIKKRAQYYTNGTLIKNNNNKKVNIFIQDGCLYADDNPIELNQVFIVINNNLLDNMYHIEFQRMDILKKEKMLVMYKNYDNSEDLVNLENKIIKINKSLKIEWDNLKKETIESFNEYKELKLISEIEFFSNDRNKPTIKIYPPKFPFAYNLKDSPLSVTEKFKLSKQSELLNQFSEKNIKIFFRLLMSNELITLKTLIEYDIIEDIQQMVIMTDILGFLFFKNYFKEITESLEYKKLYSHV